MYRRTDDPRKSTLYGSSRLINIRAVQTHARFNAQRVAGAKTCKLNGSFEQRRGNFDGVFCRDRDLLGFETKTRE